VETGVLTVGSLDHNARARDTHVQSRRKLARSIIAGRDLLFIVSSLFRMIL
jgi:hypothetical protein